MAIGARNLVDRFICTISKQTYPMVLGYAGLPLLLSFLLLVNTPAVNSTDNGRVMVIVFFVMVLFGWRLVRRSIPDIRDSSGVLNGLVFWVIHAFGWAIVCVCWGFALFFIFKSFFS